MQTTGSRAASGVDMQEDCASCILLLLGVVVDHHGMAVGRSLLKRFSLDAFRLSRLAVHVGVVEVRIRVIDQTSPLPTFVYSPFDQPEGLSSMPNPEGIR